VDSRKIRPKRRGGADIFTKDRGLYDGERRQERKERMDYRILWKGLMEMRGRWGGSFLMERKEREKVRK